MHFAGTFTNLAINPSFKPYLDSEIMAGQAEAIAKRFNGQVNPGIDFKATGDTVTFDQHTANEYSRHKVSQADGAMRGWLTTRGLTEGQHFTYSG